jgi:hypothetical protein
MGNHCRPRQPVVNVGRNLTHQLVLDFRQGSNDSCSPSSSLADSDDGVFFFASPVAANYTLRFIVYAAARGIDGGISPACCCPGASGVFVFAIAPSAALHLRLLNWKGPAAPRLLHSERRGLFAPPNCDLFFVVPLRGSPGPPRDLPVAWRFFLRRSCCRPVLSRSRKKRLDCAAGHVWSFHLVGIYTS